MNASQIDEIFDNLSSERLQTYLNLCQDRQQALCLYQKNMALSASFLAPLQICEVVLRNAIANALTFVHGQNWFKNHLLIKNLLPVWRKELQKALKQLGNHTTQSVLIPNLGFAFWQSFLTKRFDGVLWNKAFFVVFSNAPKKSVADNRLFLHQSLDEIRKFRNRIAHHEPIFNKNHRQIYQNIITAVSFCSQSLGQFLQDTYKKADFNHITSNQPNQKPNQNTWQTLHTLAQNPPDLNTLFKSDPTRGEKFTANACDIYMDFSKQLVTQEILNHLIDLAGEFDLSNKINDLLTGEKVNDTENRPALHTALRLPKSESLIVDGVDVNEQVHQSLQKCQTIARRIRQKIWRGYSGKAICDVVNIGVGGSDLGPLMATTALDEWADTDINVHFVSNMDGTQLHSLLGVLNPQTTLFIISSKSFGTADTLANAKTALHWLLSAHNNKRTVLHRHFIGVSTRTDKMSEWGIHPDNQLLLWDWVGGRFSMWSAIGLAIAIKIGMDNFYELLAGANQMDRHFASADFKNNLPVLLGLLGLWNATFLNINAHSVLPYDGRLKFFPNYLTQLEMESNGKSVAKNGNIVAYKTCPILWGDIGSNAQHAFYQLLHQGTQAVSCDFITPINRYDIAQAHDKYLENQHKLSLANCLAQSQVLAFGNHALPFDMASKDDKFLKFKQYRGNQPSTTLLLTALTPKTLGSLIALYEHKVFVMSVLWQINPFDQWGVEVGKVMANSVFDVLNGTSETIKFDSSTNALLKVIKDKA